MAEITETTVKQDDDEVWMSMMRAVAPTNNHKETEKDGDLLPDELQGISKKPSATDSTTNIPTESLNQINTDTSVSGLNFTLLPLLLRCISLNFCY